MTTATEEPQTTTSEARRMAEALTRLGSRVLGIPAPCSVSHEHYAVGYYRDQSILIWTRYDGYIVLDEPRTYYRDDVQHLARCLGTFTKIARAAMIGPEDKWIDGLHWSADGSFLGF